MGEIACSHAALAREPAAAFATCSDADVLTIDRIERVRHERIVDEHQVSNPVSPSESAPSTELCPETAQVPCFLGMCRASIGDGAMARSRAIGFRGSGRGEGPLRFRLVAGSAFVGAACGSAVFAASLGGFGRHTFALAVPPSNTGAVRQPNRPGVRASNGGSSPRNA